MGLPKITDRTYGIEVEFLSPLSKYELLEQANRLLAERRTTTPYAHYLDSSVVLHDAYYSERSYRTWKIKPDGSLNSSSGTYAHELVTPILRGEKDALRFKAVLEVLNELGATVNRSCGLHIHLGSSDLSAGDVGTIITRYSEFENDLDSIMPPSRRGDMSQWARGMGSRYVSRLKRATSKRRMAQYADRYRKVNLDSLRKHSTLEFRHHSGTTSFTKIVNWLSYLMTFVETSIKLTENRRPRRTRKKVLQDLREYVEGSGNDQTLYKLVFKGGMAPNGKMNQWRLNHHFMYGGPDEVECVGYLDARDMDACYIEKTFHRTKFHHTFRNEDWYENFKNRKTAIENGEWENENTEDDPEVFVDEGWLTDVDDDVKRYMNERKMELETDG